ncbi:MAG: hypothetical protein KHX03_09355 [Clostridium sp.]|nr:hypothetical protein [Clostridium sp.]
MKFFCCGVIYSTDDPETYWCIEKYVLKKPTKDFVKSKRIFKEVVYSLFCKKNDCSKIEIHRFFKQKEEFVLAQREALKGEKARKYLERTKNMRIKQPQCCPLRPVAYSKKIPWVYGKSIDGHTQIPRYMDESGNRDVFKNNMWQKDIIKADTVVYNA